MTLSSTPQPLPEDIAREWLAVAVEEARLGLAEGGIPIGAALVKNTQTAYTMQYGEIFFITAIVCVVGAVLGLLISGKNEHADDSNTATEMIGVER